MSKKELVNHVHQQYCGTGVERINVFWYSNVIIIIIITITIIVIILIIIINIVKQWWKGLMGVCTPR